MTEMTNRPMPTSKSRYERLYSAIEASREGMRQFRELRTDLLKQIAGKHYSDSAAEEDVPVNEMRFALYTYSQHLTPKRPQALMTTRSELFKRPAKELQIVTNDTLDAMQIFQAIEEAVLDALVSIGVTKTGISYAPQYALPNYRGSGYPYCCTVDLDDFIYDFRARKWKDIEFIGDYYRMRIDDLLGNDVYDQSVVKKLTRSERRSHLDTGEARADTISRGESASEDEYYDYADLCDVYLPHSRRLVTLSADFNRPLPPLRDSAWVGPAEGPYDILWFRKLPGQLMPLPPALNWKDMHDLINQLFLKLGDQALRQKKVGFASVRNVEDAKKTVEAKDGEVIPVDTPQNVQEMSFGGVDNNTLAFATACMGLFNRLNGNIEVLAGLGPQSNTLGQDELISAAANKQLVDMQERTFRFVASIMRKVAWIIQSDPLIDLEGETYPEIRPDIQVPFRFTADNVAGKITDYNIQVHPYSMTSQSPAARLSAVNQFMQTIAVPLYMQMAQQGIVIDWQKFVDLWSQYSQLPELKDIVKFTPIQMDPSEDPVRKPPTSTRNYVRRNVSDTSPDAERNDMIQSLMSSGSGQAA